MKKMNIIVTAGPTNERIDDVMTITNMSSGKLGGIITETFLQEKGEYIGKIFYISTKRSYRPADVSSQIEYVTIESTQDLIVSLKEIFSKNEIDVMVHSAAVGDYKPEYAVRAEDLAVEISEKIKSVSLTKNVTPEMIMEVFKNPCVVADNSGKMSSYEPHMMVKMGLTPKVIGMIKDMAPEIKLIGFKLLDKVSKEELLEVATKLREKNRADCIVANDLSKIGGGKHWAMLVDENGIRCECHDKKEIANAIINLVF